ncbi:MAG: hypothetical protein WCD81_12080 [Candidatus Bathyarchaeia archaeon]
MKTESAIGSILSAAAGLVLFSAFFLSFLITVGTFGEEWRTVLTLESTANSYTQWTWLTLELGILPIAIGLVLCAIDFMLHEKTRTKSLNQLLLCVAGGIFAAWGIYYFLRACSSYNVAIGLADHWNFGIGGQPRIIASLTVIGELRTIYAGYKLVGILWLVLGIFLSATSGYIMARAPNHVVRS